MKKTKQTKNNFYYPELNSSELNTPDGLLLRTMHEVASEQFVKGLPCQRIFGRCLDEPSITG